MCTFSRTWDSLFFSFAPVPKYNCLVSECNCPVPEYNFEFLHYKFPNTTGKVPNMNTCFRVELPVSEYSRLVSEDSHDLYMKWPRRCCCWKLWTSAALCLMLVWGTEGVFGHHFCRNDHGNSQSSKRDSFTPATRAQGHPLVPRTCRRRFPARIWVITRCGSWGPRPNSRRWRRSKKAIRLAMVGRGNLCR